MSAEATLVGTLRKGGEKRDAIHIAVAPAHTMERLYPGQRVGLSNESTNYFSARAHTMLGIVDPFLDHAVEPGEQFWVFLYPNSITGLNHVWTHPAFPGEEVAPAPLAPSRAVEAAPVGTPAAATEAHKKASEKWLRAFCATSDCPDYDTVVAAAIGDHHLNKGDDDYTSSSISDWGDGAYLHFNGYDAHGEIPPEFWDHVEVVTGRKAPKRAAHFSCSC